MKTHCASVLAAILLILYGGTQAEHGFRPRQEYTFVLEGRTVAGFPGLGEKRHVGILYRGGIKIQRDTATSILLKFQNMTYSNLHEKLPGGWWSETEGSQDQFKELPITSSTIGVKLGHNDVEGIAVKKGLEKWEINFIQGVVNQLQISGSLMPKSKGSSSGSAYLTKENSLFGRCEVQFEISKVPRAVAMAHPETFPKADICGSRSFYEILKTRNFSNCDNDPEYHFGLPKSKKCPPGGNECEDFWSRASVTRISGCGDRNDFEILQSETNTRVIANLHLNNGSQASVSSYIALNLKSVKGISRHMTPPSDYQIFADLKFQHISLKDTSPIASHFDSSSSEEEEESVTEVPHHKKTTKYVSKSKIHATTTPMPESTTKKKKVKRSAHYGHMNMELPPIQPLNPYMRAVKSEGSSFDMIQKFRELISDASNEFEVPKSISSRMTLEKVMYAVRLCRIMTYVDLSKTAAIISLQSRGNKMLQTERKLLRDVLVTCGTNPALRILKSWIEKLEITGEEAYGVVAAIPAHLQTPDARAVDEFYGMTRALAARDDPQMKTTAILALSNLLRIACVETDRKEAHYSTKHFHVHCRQQDLSNYMSWLISGAKSEGSFRRVFITALGNTGNVSALPHLRSIALDSRSSVYLRTAAVYAMKYQVLNSPEDTAQLLFSFYRDVSLPVPVRIAAVSLLFYTKPGLVTMQRIAVSTWYDPSLPVAAFVRSSLLSLANVKDPTFHTLARYAAKAYPLSRPMDLGLHRPHNLLLSRVSEDLQQIILQQINYDWRLDLTTFYYRYTQRHAGQSRNIIEVEMLAANLDLFLSKIRELLYPSEDITISRPPMKDISRSTRWIKETLQIAQRQMPKFEGDIHFIWDKMHERMFPLDKQFFVDFAKGSRKLIEEMKNIKYYNYQKVNEKSITLQVITELGFPVNFQVSVPSAFRLTANGMISTEEKAVELDINMVYTSQLFSELSFYTDWDQTVHLAGSHGITLINPPPVKVTAVFRPEERSIKVSAKAIQPLFDNVVIHHSNRPFTSQRHVFTFYPTTLMPTTSVIHTRKPFKKTIPILPNLNMTYSTEAQNDSPLMWVKNAVSVQGFCMTRPSLEANFAEVELMFDSISLQISLERATVSNGQLELSTVKKNKTTSYAESSTTPLSSTATSPASVAITTATTSTASTPTSTPVTLFSEGPSPTLFTFADDTATTATAETTKIANTTVSSGTTGEIYNFYQNQLLPRLVREPANGTTTPSTTVTTTTSTTAAPTTAASTTQTANTTSTSKPTTRIPNYTLPDSSSSSNFNASNIDPSSKGSGTDAATYLLTKMLQGVKNGGAYVVNLDANIAGKGERKYNILWSRATGRRDKEQRYGIFFKGVHPDGQTTQFRVTTRLQTPVPPMLKLNDALASNITAVLDTDIFYDVNNTEYRMSIKTNMGRNPARVEAMMDAKCLESTTPETDIQPRCHSETIDAIYLDRYNMTLTYNEESKSLGSTAKRLFDYVRYWLFPYISEDNDDTRYKNTPANTIKGFLEITPTLNSINAMVRTQSQVTEFNNVPVNALVSNLLRFHPTISYGRRMAAESYCGHANGKWVSFDGREFKYNLTSCWHVLAKDCSGRSRVVVLARSVNNQLEVEVNLDNYKVLYLRPGLDIQVNGEHVEFSENVSDFRDESGTLILRVEKTLVPEQIVAVDMPAHFFHLVYRENTVVVIADARTRSRLCGICGDNNGETVNDYMNPRNVQESNPKSFATSYSLRDSDCMLENIKSLQ